MSDFVGLFFDLLLGKLSQLHVDDGESNIAS